MPISKTKCRSKRPRSRSKRRVHSFRAVDPPPTFAHVYVKRMNTTIREADLLHNAGNNRHIIHDGDVVAIRRKIQEIETLRELFDVHSRNVRSMITLVQAYRERLQSWGVNTAEAQAFHQTLQRELAALVPAQRIRDNVHILERMLQSWEQSPRTDLTR